MFVLLLSLLSTAQAACPAERVTVAKVSATSEAATAAFAGMDQAGFETSFQQLTEYVGCLEELIRPKDAAQIHALYGYNAFVRGDEPAALRSMQVAVSLDSNFAPPASIAPSGGPLRSLFERAQTRPQVARVAFGEPENMKAYIDGAPSTQRPISAPTIVQLHTDAGRVHWSAYLTAGDTLPEWMPSAKEALRKSLGDDVIEELKLLRLEQQDNRRLVTIARELLQSDAKREYAAIEELAEKGEDEGRIALEGYVAGYTDAAVLVNGVKQRTVIAELASARLWLKVYGEFGAAETVASDTERIRTSTKVTQAVAGSEWEEVERLIRSADYSGREALTAFVDKYDGATVEVAGVVAAVDIPQLAAARDWLEIYQLAVAKLPDSTDSLAVAIELADERAVADRGSVARISKATARLLKNANDDWALTKSIADADPVKGRGVVERFVDRYERATVEIDGVVVPVAVPEIGDARDWIKNPPAAPEPAPVVDPDPPEDPAPVNEGSDAVADGGSDAPTDPIVTNPQPVTVPGQPQVIVVNPGMAGMLPMGPPPVPAKARATKAAIACLFVGGAMHGGAYVSRYYYDQGPSDELYMATNASYVGSLAMLGFTTIFTAAAIATPSIEKKAQRDAQNRATAAGAGTP